MADLALVETVGEGAGESRDDGLRSRDRSSCCRSCGSESGHRDPRLFGWWSVHGFLPRLSWFGPQAAGLNCRFILGCSVCRWSGFP